MLEEVSSPIADYLNPVELDAKRRRALGIYYTPRSAAHLLAKWAIRDSTDQILEPSFGGCTILEAAVNQLRELGCNEPSLQLFGFDVDESAFGHLRRVIGVSRHSHFALQDFLTVNPDRPIVDAVIANPPFVSYHRMDFTQRQIVRNWRDRYSPSFAMTASLWAYFLAHSMSFLKTGGRMAFVLPFAAYSSDYSQPIMEMLQSRFQSLAVYRMREQLFIQAGADERTVILLAEGLRVRTDIHSPRLEQSVENIRELDKYLSKPSSCSVGDHVQPTQIADDSAIPLAQAALEREQVVHLGDVATVRIGEVVGDTSYFVKSRAEWEQLKIPARYLRPLLTRMRQSPGVRITRQEIFHPYGAIPLLLCVRRAQSTAIRKYLDGYPAKLLQSNKTFAKRSPWYAVSYETTASAFIGSMWHESPRIVWNSAKISCANGLYKLRLRKGHRWNSLLTAASATTLFKLSAELEARVRGSGALKLEPSDVTKLLIPTVPLKLSSIVARQFTQQIDLLIRNREYESATRLADKVFYLDTEVFSPNQLNTLRDQFHDLRRQRLPNAKLG
jgi:tRNA1(Val) A37 N6-methylase TrmN6